MIRKNSLYSVLAGVVVFFMVGCNTKDAMNPTMCSESNANNSISINNAFLGIMAGNTITINMTVA